MRRDQVRQGDILLEPATHTLSAEARRCPLDARGRVVLAYGEVTGHAHALDGALAELFEERDGALYLRVGLAGAPLVHEEHGAVALAPGLYRVVRQREYAPEAIRPVAD
jgi:hypothetical protein